jgi:hypothetical protein
MPLLEPSPATLKKYGLSIEEWKALADAQDHKCFVCEQEPKKGRLCIDHFHEKGWKKMPPGQRKLYVRALCCWVCNHYYLGRGITPAKAKRVVLLLESFEARKPVPPTSPPRSRRARRECSESKESSGS